MAEMKVCACGDVNGQFLRMFMRMKSIVEKPNQNFTHLFCVGNFFGPHRCELEALKSGIIQVPIPTYILGPNVEAHKDLYKEIENVPNLTYLGKQGVYTLECGLRIVYLSGLESQEKKNERSSEDSIYYTRQDVIELMGSLKPGVVNDILLTSQWPKGVLKYDPIPKDQRQPTQRRASSLVASLAKYVKPRYHFAGLENYYHSRQPYSNRDDYGKIMHNTRFYGLGPYTVNEDEKWIYGFHITAACYLVEAQLLYTPVAATINPYEYDERLKNEFQRQYSADRIASCSRKRSIEDGGASSSKKPSALAPSDCWFCFTNVNLDKEIIIAIGNFCYVTVAKGILVPDHMLIIPVHHIASTGALSDKAYQELDKFKIAVTTFFGARNKHVAFLERHFRSPHMQLQVIPVPEEQKEEVLETLEEEAQKRNLNLTEMKIFNPKDLDPTVPYFFFEYTTGGVRSLKYLIKIENNDFPLQFGREVMAKALHVPERVDWRACADPVAEQEMAKSLKKRLEKYNFTPVKPE